jgi:hypothetical protein
LGRFLSIFWSYEEHNCKHTQRKEVVDRRALGEVATTLFRDLSSHSLPLKNLAENIDDRRMYVEGQYIILYLGIHLLFKLSILFMNDKFIERDN